MVKNNVITHFETPGQPFYTTDGDAAGRNSNIYVSSSTSTQDVQAIDWWMQAPFHAMGMMDPRLTQTGFGSYREATGGWQMAAAVDVLRGNSFTGGRYPVYFPGNGSTEPLRTYGGGESPDPLQGNCSGYTAPTGLPVFVEIGGNIATTAGPVHTFTANGALLEHCILDSSSPNVGGNLTNRGGVVLIPRLPLQTGINYVVTLTVNGLPYCSATAVPNFKTVLSTKQYSLASSDGAAWQDIDPTNLPLVCVATANQSTLLTANADLWTANAGFNQDIGIFVSDNGGADTMVAWKESGGLAGTFSPNAAYVQSLYNMASGHTYVFKLKWKTNQPASGATIFAAAGASPVYSPTSLIGVTFPTGVVPNIAVSTKQYSLANSDGTTWQAIDATNLSTTLAPAANSTAVLGANADLWTANAGFNQDIGIFVSDNGGADTLVAWKESGGFAGTFSPNAAFVKATYTMTGGHSYNFKLKWKTNRNASGATIFAAAGGGPAYSQTSLIAQTFTSGANPYSAVSTSQYSLPNSDGVTWQPIDSALNVTVAPGANTNSILGANADLWTANAGYNQDIGIFVSDNGGPDVLVAWKESGGSAGTFSPNAAFVQATYQLTGGHSYVFKLKWKTNQSAAGKTIFAAAEARHPTRLRA
jgi:hypothetical protein